MKEKLTAWLTSKAEECEAQRLALAADERNDEARFERIRANVYELFCTTANAIHRALPDEAAAWRMFEQRMEDIPSAWQRSFDVAKRHGDAEKAHIERIKLGAAEEIRRRYAALRGEQA